MLFIADTLNCVFDIWWIYDVLVNNFRACTSFLTVPVTDVLFATVNESALTTGNWGE